VYYRPFYVCNSLDENLIIDQMLCFDRNIPQFYLLFRDLFLFHVLMRTFEEGKEKAVYKAVISSLGEN
jgi:hypothetical protein